MSIFRKKPKGGPNLSSKIQENYTWSLRREESFCAGERVTAVAYDRTLRIYVCGFANGELHLYGDAPVHHTFNILPPERAVTHIQIAPAAKRLICLVENKMIVWSLDGILEREPLATVDLPGGTTFIGVSAVHSHALLPHPDGTVHMYDLSRLCESPTKIVPSPDVSEGVIMDLASSPRNVDFLVVATYGSLYLWQFSAHRSLRKFLLPEDAALRPVCLAFHPHESIFVAGMADGKFAFWNIDDGVPLFVTTIFELTSEPHQVEDVSEVLEPVFKLAWSWFSRTSRLFLHILGGQPAGRRLTTLEFAGTPFSETDQLVPKSALVYSDYDTANMKDFMVLEDSGHILVLNEDGSLLFIPFTAEQGIQDSDQRATKGGLYEPYELRRRSIICHTVIGSLEKLRRISPPENQCKQKGFAEGGLARPHTSKGGPDPRLVKYEAPFLLAALHEDGIIYIDDISPRLFVESEVLETSYPQPMPNLTVNLKGILEEPLLWASLDDASSLSVKEITFVSEALELYILFKTGEVLVCKYNDSLSTDGPSGVASPHLVDLSTLATDSHAFAPRFLFSCNEGACVAFATCEVGFTAVAYANSSVYLLNMRGPNIMFHQTLSSVDGDAVLTLRFAICRPDLKSPERLLLLAFHISGLVSILTIQKVGSAWAVDKKIEEIPARKSLPRPISCLLVDILTGGALEATAKALSSLLSDKAIRRESKLSYEGEFYRITVSNTTVRCDMGLSGKNLKTLQLEGILNAGIINNNASSALALFREDGALTIVSLPNLETIADIQDKTLSSSCMLTARFLGGSGDFSVKTADGLEIWSTSSSARVERPDIMLPLPAPSPSGQEGGLISWLLGMRVMTGEEFDTLVAGPNRPPLPINALRNAHPASENGLQEAMAATEERGLLVTTLQDKTDELEHAAEGMAAQAQKLAAKTQSKRRRFGF